MEVGYCSLEDGSAAVDDQIWLYEDMDGLCDGGVLPDVESYGDALPFGPSLLEALHCRSILLSSARKVQEAAECSKPLQKDLVLRA